MSATDEQRPEPATHEQPGRPGFWAAGRHPVNVGHLVMGLAFLGLAGVWALLGTDVVDGGELQWLLPVPWVVAGAVGLVATTLSGARRRDRWAGNAPHPGPRPTDPTDHGPGPTDHETTPLQEEQR